MDKTQTLLGAQSDGAPQAAVILDAWSVVDSIDRLRTLVTQFPQLDQGGATAQFRDGTAPFRELRNLVQHLDKRIPGLLSRNEPVWGSLSWIAASDDADEGHFYIAVAVAGAVVKAANRPAANPLGKVFNLPVDHFELTSRGKDLRSITVSLTDGIRYAQTFITALEKALASQFSGLPTLGADITVLIEARLTNDAN